MHIRSKCLGGSFLHGKRVLSTTQSDADGNDGETTRDIKQKKLSYRRDNARRRLLCRRSRLFKVTDFGINRKPACDFLSVNNLHPISHRLQVIADYQSNVRARIRIKYLNSQH